MTLSLLAAVLVVGTVVGSAFSRSRWAAHAIASAGPIGAVAVMATWIALTANAGQAPAGKLVAAWVLLFLLGGLALYLLVASLVVWAVARTPPRVAGVHFALVCASLAAVAGFAAR